MTNKLEFTPPPLPQLTPDQFWGKLSDKAKNKKVEGVIMLHTLMSLQQIGEGQERASQATAYDLVKDDPAKPDPVAKLLAQVKAWNDPLTYGAETGTLNEPDPIPTPEVTQKTIECASSAFSAMLFGMTYHKLLEDYAAILGYRIDWSEEAVATEATDVVENTTPDVIEFPVATADGGDPVETTAIEG